MRELPRYEFDGEMLTAGEIAIKTDITPSIISSRLHAGKRGEALKEPPISRSEAAARAGKAAGKWRSRPTFKAKQTSNR